MSEAKKIGFRMEIETRAQFGDHCWTMRLFPMEYDTNRHRWTGYGGLSSYADNALSHLVLECYGDQRTHKLYRGYEYKLKDIYSVNEREVVAMAKVMTGIENALKKAREKDGEALSFGQFCLRVAKAVKAQYFLFLKLNAKELGYQDDERWHIRSLAEGQSHIDYEIRKWQEAGKEQEAA